MGSGLAARRGMTEVLSDLDPCARLGAARHRVDGPLDSQAILEIDQPCLLAAYASDQFAALDDLEIVEAEPMARARG